MRLEALKSMEKSKKKIINYCNNFLEFAQINGTEIGLSKILINEIININLKHNKELSKIKKLILDSKEKAHLN